MAQSGLGSIGLAPADGRASAAQIAARALAQHARRLQHRRDAQRVPSGVQRAVDERRRPLQPRRVQLLLRLTPAAPRSPPACDSAWPQSAPPASRTHSTFFAGSCGISPLLADVVVRGGHGEFVRAQHGARLFQRPGEVAAVVVQIDVGVLRAVVAAALAVAQPLAQPAQNVARHIGKERIARGLPGVHVVLQQLGVVIGHLLEVRHAPALIHRVAMEAAGKLVVHSAARHLFQRGDDHLAHQLLRRCAHTSRSADPWPADGETSEHCRSRRFRGRRAPAPTAPSCSTIAGEKTRRAVPAIPPSARAACISSSLSISSSVAPLAEGLRNRQQHPPEAGASVAVLAEGSRCRRKTSCRPASETPSAASRPAR